MFSQLTNFAFQRSAIQALGFYIASLLFVTIVSVLVAWAIIAFIIFGYPLNPYTWIFVGFLAQIISGIIVLILAIEIMSRKKLFSQFGRIPLGLAAGIFSFFFSGLLGLIPVAYLTTLPNPQAAGQSAPTPPPAPGTTEIPPQV